MTINIMCYKACILKWNTFLCFDEANDFPLSMNKFIVCQRHHKIKTPFTKRRSYGTHKEVGRVLLLEAIKLQFQLTYRPAVGFG